MNKKNKELLFSVTIKDCLVQTFRCGGKGGQNVNKVETGVRIIHEPSGAITESCEERSQWLNKQIAFNRLAEHPKFTSWQKIEIGKRLGKKNIEEIVDEQMVDANLKIEIKDENGRWKEE